MRRPVTPIGVLSLIICLCLGLACSSGGGGDGPVDPGGGSLDDVTLTASSSVSFGKIYLQGMPSPKGAPVYTARMSVGEQVFGDLLVDSDENGYFIHAPLYPPAPNDGGTVRIQVRGGEEQSGQLPLEVEPLPEAPGAYEAVVNALRAHVAQRAEGAGTTFEELAATSFEAVDPQLFRLKLAQSYVDSGEEVDMVNLIANEAEFLDAEQRELLDRIFGYAPFDEVLQLDIDHFNAGKLPPWRPETGSALDTAAKGGCIDASPDISTPGELSQAMLRAALSQAAIDPDGPAGETLSKLGTTLTAGSFIPGAGVVFSLAGAVVAVWQASREYYAGVYPSRFTSLSFELDKAEYDEDETVPGRWDKVMVTAVADGWVAEQALGNVITTALGAYVSGIVNGGMASAEVLTTAAMTKLNVELDAYLEFLDANLIEFCGRDWTVDITGEPWSTAGVLNHKLDVNVQTRELLPADVGADFLVVAAQANKFGGQTIDDSKAVEVKAIEVTLDKDDYYITNPGETINLTATITNAKRTWLDWTTEAGSFEDGLGVQTNGSATRPLKTPTNPSSYPFQVLVESASREGLRESGQPPRRAIATIRNDVRVKITPTFECVAPGETVQFDAELFGLTGATLIWSKVEGYGSIDQSGLYTALPTGTSNAKIKVEVEGYPNAVDYAYVDVGECNCEMVLDVGFATTSQSYGSSQIAFLRSNFEGYYFYQFFIHMPDTEMGVGASIVGTEAVPPPGPGGLGTFDAGLSLIFGGTDSWVSGGEQGQSSVTVTITEHTVDRMVGEFNGDVYKYDQQGEIAATLGIHMTFVAGHWSGGWPCN